MHIYSAVLHIKLHLVRMKGKRVNKSSVFASKLKYGKLKPVQARSVRAVGHLEMLKSQL